MSRALNDDMIVCHHLSTTTTLKYCMLFCALSALQHIGAIIHLDARYLGETSGPASSSLSGMSCATEMSSLVPNGLDWFILHRRICEGDMLCSPFYSMKEVLDNKEGKEIRIYHWKRWTLEVTAATSAKAVRLHIQNTPRRWAVHVSKKFVEGLSSGSDLDNQERRHSLRCARIIWDPGKRQELVWDSKRSVHGAPTSML